MIQWKAGKYPKSPRAKVAPGNEVAMAFATMLEIGTSRQPAKPAIRNTLNGAKQMIIDKIAAGYTALLEKYSR